MRKQIIFAHVREHTGVYIVLTVVMLLGVVKGSIDLMNLTDITVTRLGDYIKNFFVGSVRVEDVFLKEIVTLAKVFLVVWVSGSSLLGAPVIAYVVYFKGYTLGFLSTVFVKTMGLRGIGMMTMVLLSKEIFLIPITIALGVTAIHFSLCMLNSKRMMHNKSVARQFAYYGLAGIAYGMLALSVVAINAELLSNGHCQKMIEVLLK